MYLFYFCLICMYTSLVLSWSSFLVNVTAGGHPHLLGSDLLLPLLPHEVDEEHRVPEGPGRGGLSCRGRGRHVDYHLVNSHVVQYSSVGGDLLVAQQTGFTHLRVRIQNHPSPRWTVSSGVQDGTMPWRERRRMQKRALSPFILVVYKQQSSIWRYWL